MQDHGVVEIMRGCPNGCRFCQAGYMYRPHREKDAELIIAEVDRLVTRSGYTEITLASLSTGDYSGILDLLKNLNDRYSSRGVSFSLPSLKISSFLLPILREVKVVRKTGLTFAVETPEEQWQLCLNKSTEAEKITDILKHARELGWKGAKFYFMIGLPPSFNEDEENAIVRFMQSLYAQVPMNYTVNVGTFVPKPHTPYQWAPMLDEREAFRRAMYIKKSLSKRFFKVSFHDTFQSFLEAMISRGDERAGDIIEKAFRAGAVLDAWEEHLDKNAWRSAIETADWDVAAETLTGRSFEKPLPWDVIDLHVASGFLAKEREKSLKGELTGACEEPCGHNCGSCRGERSIRQAGRNAEPGTGTGASQPDGDCVKYLFSFKKLDAAVYLSHLNLVRIFERAFIRSGFQPCYSEGFNPQPKIEFAQPLSLGVETHGDMCAVELKGNPGCAELERACNSALPEGIGITSIRALPANPDGRKPPSLMSLYAGSDYTVQPDGTSSGLSLEKVAEKLEGYFTRKNITNCGVSAGAEFLEVKIRPHSEGRGNILAILREALDTDEPLGLGLSVARTRMWAGTGGKGEADYFSVFNV
ncbi:MAG: DUF2344 domain-containing protein [Spirochaetales bacterium]|nr:MAG: DUF2344 domain-containing protein [Spirochaetales bacterium]